MTRAGLLAIVAAACGSEAPALDVHVVAAGDDDPFGAATRARARLVDDGGQVLVESVFSVASGGGAFGDGIPFGRARVTIEALDANDAVLARGSTRALDLDGASVRVTVFTGSVDRFFATIDESHLPTAMTAGVVGTTATSVDDEGTVLITGGVTVDASGAIAGVSRDAFLYDPSTGRFEPAGQLGQARAGHTATQLRPEDGVRRILIAGGVTMVNDQLEAAATAELYDPASRTFTPVAPLASARAFHSATLLVDGRVLLAGGMRPDPLGGGAAGWEGITPEAAAGSVLAGSEAYDPAARAFVAGPALEAPRFGHAAVRAGQDGRVLLAGGRDAGGGALASTAIVDPGGAQADLGPPLSAPRDACAIVRTGEGVLWVLGGRSDPADPTSQLASTDIIDLATGQSDGPALAAPRAGHAITPLPGGRFLVSGGLGLGGIPRPDAEVVTPGGVARVVPGPLHDARAWHAAALLPGDMVLLAGGLGGDPGARGALAGGEVFVDPAQ